MKKSKIFAGALFIVSATFFTSCGGKGDLIQVNHDITQYKGMPDALDVYIDASKSMEGYLNKDENEGSFEANLGALNSSVKEKLNKDSVHFYSLVGKSAHLYTCEFSSFNDSLRNQNFFNGQTSRLDEMFETAVNNLLQKQKHVVAILTDGILSSNEARKGSTTNFDERQSLADKVKDQMSRISSSMSVAVVKYTGDYNREFYYDYKGNKLDEGLPKTMKERPYYLILIGKREYLNTLFASHIIPNEQNARGDIFSYSNKPSTPKFRVIKAIKCANIIGDVQDNMPLINTNLANKVNNTPYFYLAVEDFCVPAHLEGNLEKIMNKPIIEGGIVASCERVQLSDVEEDYLLNPNDSVNFTYLYKVTLKDLTTIKNTSDNETSSICFISSVPNAESSSISKDDVTCLDSLKGKTFSFSYLIDGIRGSFSNQDADKKIAEIKFNFKKNK